MTQSKPITIPIYPNTKFRRFFFHLVRSRVFDKFILGTIVANTITLIIDFYGAPKVFKDFLHYSNIVFVIIFSLEIILRCIGLGPRFYISIN